MVFACTAKPLHHNDKASYWDCDRNYKPMGNLVFINDRNLKVRYDKEFDIPPDCPYHLEQFVIQDEKKETGKK